MTSEHIHCGQERAIGISKSRGKSSAEDRRRRYLCFILCLHSAASWPKRVLLGIAQYCIVTKRHQVRGTVRTYKVITVRQGNYNGTKV
jgi:hypothetical protein